jgi:hypothetical protein
VEGLTLDAAICTSIFERKGHVRQLDVYLTPGLK